MNQNNLLQMYFIEKGDQSTLRSDGTDDDIVLFQAL